MADCALYCARCGGGSTATVGAVTVTADLAAYEHAWQLRRDADAARELVAGAYDVAYPWSSAG